MNLQEFIDCHFGEDGVRVLRERLESGEDANSICELTGEAPLHTAVRRRRLEAVQVLITHGVDLDALSRFGKTAYAHARRRGFDEVADCLEEQGANIELSLPDQFAVLVTNGRLDEARQMLASNPEIANTGNPEEDRLLADMAGRNESGPVEFLIEAGANLAATGLDDGTPLHQAAWFGQPRNAKLLVEAGAPLDHFETTHGSSPLHWAVHGGRYSGGAEERQDLYVEIVRLLLDAGSSLNYPDGQAATESYRERLLADATPKTRSVLEEHFRAKP